MVSQSHGPGPGLQQSSSPFGNRVLKVFPDPEEPTFLGLLIMIPYISPSKGRFLRCWGGGEEGRLGFKQGSGYLKGL